MNILEKWQSRIRGSAEKTNENKTRRSGSVTERADRVFGVVLATVILIGFLGLGLEFVLVKGPSPTLKEMFVMSMIETRRFGFLANIYLDEAEVEEIKSRHNTAAEENADISLIDLDNPSAYDYGLVDADGDGLILDEVKGRGYSGYMLVVLDPSRVFVGQPDSYGGVGMKLREMCRKYGAVGGINGGGFVDESGTGLGGQPAGLTVVDGVYYNEGTAGDNFVGLDADGYLHVGWYNGASAKADNIVCGVTFGPILVVNGEAASEEALASGVNPRTAIGQRGDGAILMLVIDGRQAHSIGATYMDMAEIMLNYGAVNACNLDGGSSTSLYLNGEYVNSSSAAEGPRPLPSAFLVR